MYDRFTKRARLTMQLANQEAVRLEHEYIAPEHIVVGLLKAGDCGAMTVLKTLGVNISNAMADGERIVESLTKQAPVGEPRAKKVIEFAMMEARDLQHSYVGTVHLLLALLRAGGYCAENALINQSLTAEAVREEINKSMPESGPPKSDELD
jgi:ATP-dependent Clp protease ATP-binding subunit ClpC